MAKKAEKINKKTIVGICIAAVIAITIIIVAIVVHNNKLDDSFFVSDGSKYVLTLESDDVSFEEDEHNPIKTHLVYFYSGDKITDLKAYYEYADSAAAKSAADYIKENYSDDEYEKVSVNGKYLIFTADKSEYEDLTASEVKEQIELMENIQNTDDEEDEDYEDEDELDEGDEDYNE